MKEAAINIGRQMEYLVEEYFFDRELREIAMNFLQEKIKDSCLFGKLTVIFYHMFGGRKEDIYKAAAGVECMIFSLDIYDDLQDQDQPDMPWMKIDPALAINIAIGLRDLGNQAILTTSFTTEEKLQAFKLFNQQVLKAVNGQFIDIANNIFTEKDYIHMVENKSGALLASACLVGAALAGQEELDLIEKTAINLGIAAQLKNDIKDISSWDEKNDFLNKKRTLPILYLLSQEGAEYHFIRDYYSGELTREEIKGKQKEFEQLVSASSALHYSSVLMKVYYYEFLSGIEECQVPEEWKQLINQVVNGEDVLIPQAV